MARCGGVGEDVGGVVLDRGDVPGGERQDLLVALHHVLWGFLVDGLEAEGSSQAGPCGSPLELPVRGQREGTGWDASRVPRCVAATPRTP